MEKFTIAIETNIYNSIDLYMEPCTEVPEVAAKMSLAYPGSTVVVSMGGTAIRWIYKDGVKIVDNADLNVFYSNVESQDEWNWSCLGRYPAK